MSSLEASSATPVASSAVASGLGSTGAGEFEVALGSGAVSCAEVTAGGASLAPSSAIPS